MCPGKNIISVGRTPQLGPGRSGARKVPNTTGGEGGLMLMFALLWMWLPIIIIGGLLFLIWRALKKKGEKNE